MYTKIFREAAGTTRSKPLFLLEAEHDLRWLRRKNYRVVNAENDLQACAGEMLGRRLVSFDCETTGLMIAELSADNPLKDKIVGMSFSWERDQGIYIPFEHTEIANLDKKLAFHILEEVLTGCHIVTHNGLFDGKVLYDEGVKLNICEDTMLLFFDIDSTVSKGSKGLKNLVRSRYGVEMLELTDIFGSSKDAGLFRYIDADLIAPYACADSDYTLQLLMDTFSELTAGQRTAYRFDVTVMKHLIRSEYVGKGIDTERLPIVSGYNDIDLERLETVIYRYVGYRLCELAGSGEKRNQYRFSISSGPELSYVLYNLLGYEPLETNPSGDPSTDKSVLKALADRKGKPEAIIDELVPEDIISSAKEDPMFSDLTKKDLLVLEKSELDASDCKLAVLILAWRKLHKLKTSFYAPLLNNNFEGRYFSPVSMTRAETARVVDRIQTLDKKTKRLIIPYDKENQYFFGFDFCQIEYRVMAYIAQVEWLINQLNNPENDYHREGGAPIMGTTPQKMTEEQRDAVKAINFGIPYKMSAKGIVTKRYGKGLSKEEIKKYTAETEEMLEKWHASLGAIEEELNRYRARALKPLPDQELPRHLKGRQVGRIGNPFGRTRLFALDGMSSQKRAAVERKAGNYPIQSFAREIFFTAYIKLCERLIAEGYMDIRVPDDAKASGYRFVNKVSIPILVHDECEGCADRDIDPMELFQIISEECTLRLEGHPTYFTDMNIGNNWLESKSAAVNIPTAMLMDEALMGRPRVYGPGMEPLDYVSRQVRQYYVQRIAEELDFVDPGILGEGVINVATVTERLTNYYVIPILKKRIKPLRDCAEGGEWDDRLLAGIEAYVRGARGQATVIYPDGSVQRYAGGGTDMDVSMKYAHRTLDKSDDDSMEGVEEVAAESRALCNLMETIRENVSAEVLTF